MTIVIYVPKVASGIVSRGERRISGEKRQSYDFIHKLNFFLTKASMLLYG